ncbi:MAG: LysE family translocator, partial [Bacteroidaceae bacterium]
MMIDPITTLNIMINGMLIGIIASAPMGPVGVLTVRRTLNKGLWFGFATGVGAALSDLIYATITLWGMSMVLEWVEKPSTLFYLKLGGSILLFFFGWYTFRSKPSQVPAGKNRGSLMSNMITGFL